MINAELVDMVPVRVVKKKADIGIGEEPAVEFVLIKKGQEREGYDTVKALQKNPGAVADRSGIVVMTVNQMEARKQELEAIRDKLEGG